MSAFQAERQGFESPIPLLSFSIMDPIKILLLIGELEGCYTYTRKLGFEEDNKILDEMKKRYYKLYFKLCKEQGRNPYG